MMTVHNVADVMDRSSVVLEDSYAHVSTISGVTLTEGRLEHLSLSIFK